MPNQNLEKRIRDVIYDFRDEYISIDQALSSILQAFREIVPKQLDMDFSWLGGSKEDIKSAQDEQTGFNSAIQQIRERIGG